MQNTSFLGKIPEIQSGGLISIYIVEAKRTAIGQFQGALSSLSAPELGAIVLKDLLKEKNIPVQGIDECIIGQVLTAGSKQAPSRQTALNGGLDPSTPCTTVNKVCGSGLKAIMMACDSIELKRAHIVIAGGQESMSSAPHLLNHSRSGFRLGDIQLKDSILEDGLLNPYDNQHMGVIGEMCAEKYKLSREEQDQFAKKSYEKVLKAQKESWFKKEITPVTIKTKKETKIISEDEEPSRVQFEKISKLPTIFKKEGTITPANASKINDGASLCLLASETAVKKYKLKPLARVITQSVFAQDPHWFTTAPISSINKALEQSDLKPEDIDLFEVNEAFSAVAMAVSKEIPIPADRLNVHGGAVALGHPIGASGARILTTLVHALKTHKKKKGVASICLGGGEALTLIVESC